MSGNQGGHMCPWPRCPREARAGHFMCRSHWYALPAEIRRQILAAYVPGQTALTATPEYMAAARAALTFAAQDAGRERR